MRYLNLYTPENVERAKYAQAVVAAVAVALCLFVLVTTVLGVQRVRNTEAAVREAVSHSRTLSRTSAALKDRAARQARMGRGGVDCFALQLSKWSREDRVEVESLSPEGAPASMDVRVGEITLGKWNVHKVRVAGRGEFTRVMSLLGRFRDPCMPVQMEAVQVTAVDSGISGIVTFNVLCTVYEKKSESS